MVFFFSDAGINTLAYVLTLYLIGAWALVWLARLALALWRPRKQPSAPSKHLIRRWGYEPAIIFLGLALGLSGSLALVRFSLSAPSLERYVLDVKIGKVDINSEWTHPPRTVGLYRITVTDLLEDGTVRFITSSSGLFNYAGFANAPNGSPPQKAKNFYRHIYGPWWRWEQDF